jgi:hypothetical protein
VQISYLHYYHTRTSSFCIPSRALDYTLIRNHTDYNHYYIYSVNNGSNNQRKTMPIHQYAWTNVSALLDSLVISSVMTSCNLCIYFYFFSISTIEDWQIYGMNHRNHIIYWVSTFIIIINTNKTGSHINGSCASCQLQ